MTNELLKQAGEVARQLSLDPTEKSILFAFVVAIGEDKAEYILNKIDARETANMIDMRVF
jgi:hypothetical protein